jgi:hypothetical protein
VQNWIRGRDNVVDEQHAFALNELRVVHIQIQPLKVRRRDGDNMASNTPFI